MNRSAQAPSVLVIGAGMYVCGRGTDGVGTVLPTLALAQAEGHIGAVAVACTSPEGLRGLRDKVGQINTRLGTTLNVRGYPADGGRDPFAYRKALAELPRPACGIVVVPDHLHASVAADLIDDGVHVLVVKPLTPTVAEAKRLIERVQARGVYGAVEFHKRFDEANLLLRQTLADGRLGEVRYITVEFSQRRSIRDAFQSWIHHTNIFQYLGVHYADLIYFLTGARPVRVLATGQPSGAIRDGLWRLDAVQATVEWEDQRRGNSFVSMILTNWIDPDRSPAMSDQRITVVGTLGRYESDQTARGVRVTTTQAGFEEPNPYFSQLYTAATGDRVVEGYGPRSIRQFLADVRDLADGRHRSDDFTTTRPSFQEALVSTAVVEAVNQSLAQGEQWVVVEDASSRSATVQGASL